MLFRRLWIALLPASYLTNRSDDIMCAEIISKTRIDKFNRKSEKKKTSNIINDEWRSQRRLPTVHYHYLFCAMAFCFWTINNNIVLWFRCRCGSVQCPLCIWLVVSVIIVHMNNDNRPGHGLCVSFVHIYHKCVKKRKRREIRLAGGYCQTQDATD